MVKLFSRRATFAKIPAIIGLTGFCLNGMPPLAMAETAPVSCRSASDLVQFCGEAPEGVYDGWAYANSVKPMWFLYDAAGTEAVFTIETMPKAAPQTLRASVLEQILAVPPEDVSLILAEPLEVSATQVDGNTAETRVYFAQNANNPIESLPYIETWFQTDKAVVRIGSVFTGPAVTNVQRAFHEQVLSFIRYGEN
jgi:hypothetical protein